jgi:hypothetical protein
MELDTHFQKIGFERYFSGLQADLYPKGSRFRRINLFNALGFVSHFSLTTNHHFSSHFDTFHCPTSPRKIPRRTCQP